MSDPIAKQDIEAGTPGRGVFAFRRGQTVPAQLVKDHGWGDLVVGAGTKEARTILAEIAGEPVADADAAAPADAAATSGKKG